jgi:dolichol-phosphate mannosyltransferase
MAETGADLSIIIPFFNEAQNVSVVLDEVCRVLPAAEIIAVDDGSTDDTWAAINRASGVRGLRLARNSGQSAAVYVGLRAATRKLCTLMDGDGQNDPAGFLVLLAEWRKGTGDIICGFRATRQDSWNRRLMSRVANAIRRWFFDDGVRDTGCSQKLFPREAVDLLVPFRGMHRFLPAIFKQGGLRIVEVPVNHRPRHAGKSSYTTRARAIAGAYDLIGVGWLLRRKIVLPQVEEK